jgi:hypothetical protein
MVRGGGGHACQILECWFFICGHFRGERSWRKAVHIFDVIHHLGIKFHGFRCFNKRAFQLILSNAFPGPKTNMVFWWRMSARSCGISRIFGLCQKVLKWILHITHANSGSAESRSFKKCQKDQRLQNPGCHHARLRERLWRFWEEHCAATLPAPRTCNLQGSPSFTWLYFTYASDHFSAICAQIRLSCLGRCNEARGDVLPLLPGCEIAGLVSAEISCLSTASRRPTYPTSSLPESPFPGDGDRLSRLNLETGISWKTMKTLKQRWSNKETIICQAVPGQFHKLLMKLNSCDSCALPRSSSWAPRQRLFWMHTPKSLTMQNFTFIWPIIKGNFGRLSSPYSFYFLQSEGNPQKHRPWQWE